MQEIFRKRIRVSLMISSVCILLSVRRFLMQRLRKRNPISGIEAVKKQQAANKPQASIESLVQSVTDIEDLIQSVSDTNDPALSVLSEEEVLSTNHKPNGKTGVAFCL